jgi:hypothetical protein
LKLFIIGHGRHGKDTVAEFIRDKYGLTFESSSKFCAEHVVRPWLAKIGIEYDSLEECYDDRHTYRVEWYHAIMEFNEDDPSRLSREIFNTYDMYVGIRSRVEFLAAKQYSDLSIWVDAFQRHPEPDPTCVILKSDCDIVIDNNGSIEEQQEKLTRLFDLLISTTNKRGELACGADRARSI